MAVDYDVVIVGGTPLGREMALQAAHWGARVALVEPPPIPTLRHWQFQTLLPLMQEAIGAQQVLATAPTRPDAASLQTWGEWAIRKSRQTAQIWQEDLSLALMATAGVDVVLGEAEFSRRSRFGIQVADRVLRSRTYLMLLPGKTLLPALPGLDSAQPLIPEAMLEAAFWEHLPRRLLVLGGGADACEWAQTLANLGMQITLVSETPLLPDWEPTVASTVLAILEAAGVTVLAPTQIQRIWVESGEKWIKTKEGAIAADALLATGPAVPSLGYLNPEFADIALDRGFFSTNARHQTNNPRIYACNAEAPTAHRSAQIALKNALFLPIFRDRQPPLRICRTDPPAISWGLTEAQARQQHNRLQVVDWIGLEGAAAAVQAQLSRLSGQYKLLVKPSGHLLGAHLVAPQADNWLGLLMIAQQRRIPLQALSRVPLLSSSLAMVVHRLAQRWQAQRINQFPWFKTRLENWFDGCRDRVS